MVQPAMVNCFNRPGENRSPTFGVSESLHIIVMSVLLMAACPGGVVNPCGGQGSCEVIIMHQVLTPIFL